MGELQGKKVGEGIKADLGANPAANPPLGDADLKAALDNLKEAAELFCMAYGEVRSTSCSGESLTLEVIERGLAEETRLIEGHGLREKREKISRLWHEGLRIPRNKGEVEVAIAAHHGATLLERYARRLAQTSAHYLVRISSHPYEPGRRGFIIPKPGGRILIVTSSDAGFALELQTTAREDWQTGIIASYLKLANPALLGEFTIG